MLITVTLDILYVIQLIHITFIFIIFIYYYYFFLNFLWIHLFGCERIRLDHFFKKKSDVYFFKTKG